MFGARTLARYISVGRGWGAVESQAIAAGAKIARQTRTVLYSVCVCVLVSVCVFVAILEGVCVCVCLSKAVLVLATCWYAL